MNLKLEQHNRDTIPVTGVLHFFEPLARLEADDRYKGRVHNASVHAKTLIENIVLKCSF